MLRSSGQPPLKLVTITKLEPWGTFVNPGWSGLPDQPTLIALNWPFGSPGPPWIGIFSSPRISYWYSPRGASYAIPALSRSVTASASDRCTVGLAMLSPDGVLTGFDESKGVEKMLGSPVGGLAIPAGSALK